MGCEPSTILPSLLRDSGDDELLTAGVFGPVAVRHPAHAHAFTANGLAG